MSISQMQGFAIPSTDVPMETDADRRASQAEIIDIDLDLAEEQQQDREDEYMSEDVTTFNHQGMGIVQTDASYNDDEMVDDGDVEQELVYEASIQDEVLQDAEQIITVEPDEDDEIIDVVDNEPLPAPEIKDTPQYQEFATNEDSIDKPQEDQTFQLVQVQDIDDAQYQQYLNRERNNSQNEGDPEPSRDQEPEYSNPQYRTFGPQKMKTHDSRNESSLDIETEGQQQRDSPKPVASNESTEALSEAIGYAPSDSNKAGDHQSEEGDKTIHDLGAPDNSDKSNRGQDLPPISPISHHLDQIDSIDHYEQPSQAAIYVHPVIVIYQGAEISLFRPVDGDRDFILEDENLADDSIANLLAGCRPVLGEEVNEQELIIRVNDLDLQICEFGNDASMTTISQLIDIYLQLQHHDGIENPPDLRLRLSTQPSSSHRLEILRNAVEEGKGLSQIKLPEGDQEGDRHSLEDQRGKYEDGKALNDPLVPTGVGSQQQNNDENKTAICGTKSSNVSMAPAVKDERVPHDDSQKADVQAKSEQASNVTDEEHERKENLALKTKDQHYKRLQLKDSEPATVDAFAESETHFQPGEEPALPDDKEDIIDYEDEPIGPESSSGSSTLHGDLGTIDQAPPSSAPPNAFKEEAVPETETSSHTLEESSNNLANHKLHVSEETDDLYDAEDGHEATKDSPEGAMVKFLETQVWNLETDEEEDGGRFANEENVSEVDGNNDGDYRDHNNRANDGDHIGSSKAHREEFEENRSGKVQHEDIGTVGEEDYIEDTSALDQKETHGRSGLQHLQEGNYQTKAEHEKDSGPVNATEDPNITAMDEHQTYENEVSDDADLQAPLHADANTEDNYEITYGDEGEDEDNESKVSNIERDEVPGVGSLKRSRGNLDADDAAAEDLQDAKRTRST